MRAASSTFIFVAGEREVCADGWAFFRYFTVILVFAANDLRQGELRFEAGESDRTANCLALISLNPG